MDHQDPDQRKRFESFLLDYMIRTARMASIESPPPIPINTPPPAAAQNKGKSIVGSSAPRMIGSSSQFPVDAYPNLQNPAWKTFWEYNNFQLVQLLMQTPYNLWSHSYLQLAAQRTVQFKLHLLILMINNVLKLRSMDKVSPFAAPKFDKRDSHYLARQAGMNYTHFPFHRRPQFGADQICSRLGERVISSFLREADTEQQPKKKAKLIGFVTQDDQQKSPFYPYHNWLGEVVPLVNICNMFSRQKEANFSVSAAVAGQPGLKTFAHFYEEGLESNSQSLINNLMNPLNPVSAIWSERDFQQLESLIQTPYFMWSNTGFKLAFRKMRQLVLRLLLLKIEAGQIPFPVKQAIPPNVRVPAPQRQRELSIQLSSINSGQDSKTGNMLHKGSGSYRFDLNKKDDAAED